MNGRCTVCGVGSEEYVLVESSLWLPKEWLCMFCFEWAVQAERVAGNRARLTRPRSLLKPSPNWLDRGYVPKGAERLG